MSWSIKLFKLKGIQVKVHLTFILILIWAAYRWSSLAEAGLQGALFGVVATLLLFGSVILHEFGHSLQALKYGISVRDITLLPIGGIAQMEEIPEKPDQELRIALAGPLVNFVLVALLIGIGTLLQAKALITVSELLQSLGQAHWTGMLAYLTMANLALGLFNLVPAYPMDGGRVLRALLAMRLDYGRATTIAVAVGQGLALMLGLWGFSSGSFGLVLIAIFVWLGAAQEGKQVEVKSVLNKMKVSQAMTYQPQTLPMDASLARAVGLTLKTFQADFPVMQKGDSRLAGFLTAGDLLNGLQAHGAATPVSQVMRTHYPTAMPDDLLFRAQQQMTAERVRALPVVHKDGRLIGLLRAEDINEAYRLLSVYPKLTLVS